MSGQLQFGTWDDSPAGMVVLERLIVPGRTDLDLHALASGAYNLSIEYQNKAHTRRIVIQ